ncbi:hypothetical protein PCANC_00086 [Puccinia coronata f. sp. avenae]|uniref:HAT C-terminal dimerisation domain-containing protein n=1 Tax=Puccinia coronata f. sp. avenae TaxID=200324 RepID=A0A2N5W8B2_9BASI|nr:hypothetical protein PCANC_00086 [Puccinia coronata f. sp. avenae]
MACTPRTQRRNQQSTSPSQSIEPTKCSNSNTQPPLLDDAEATKRIIVIKDNASFTQPDTPSTSQPNTSGPHKLTDLEELSRAQKTAENTVSAAYASYHAPKLSKKLDKKGFWMIAYPCKMCGTRINLPTSDSSCSNLLKNAAACLNKERAAISTHKLGMLGVSGTGDIDPQEVPQMCAIWCAEAARPFSILANESLKMILHPTVLKHIPSDKVISQSIHMLYTAIQDSYRAKLCSILRPFGTAKNKTTTPANDDDVTSLHSSDICEDDDAEDQIRCQTSQPRYENNPSNHCDNTEIKDSDEDAEPDDLQHKLTLEDINDLSDKDEENNLYTSNCSPLYRIAMDKYFKIAGWENEWINKAVRLTREMFNTYYKPEPNVPITHPPKATKPKTGNIAQLSAAQAPRGQSTNDPINMWLAAALLLDDGSPIDALKWWIQQKRAGNTNGGLLQMALDILSCPATSHHEKTIVT